VAAAVAVVVVLALIAVVLGRRSDPVAAPATVAPITGTESIAPGTEAGHPTAVGGISTDISDRKKAMDALAAEQELLRHIIEIQDEERQLVTCEIHDGLVQYAAGALMQLEAARAEIESESAREKIDQVMSILRKTVAEGRRLINGIRTPVLDDWGVVAALENLIDEEDRANVTVEFVKDPELGRMAPNVEEALYRITQEAMTNTYKHSNTTRVRIELVRRGDRVRLEVRDWGTGFTPAARSNRVHGLHGMTTRARIAGGHCTILSTPGEGTQVVAELPYLGRT
jgi:signal transduction histidine kinase